MDERNRKKKKKRCSGYDDALENAVSFEEARAIITARLNHLCTDLSDCPEIEQRFIKEINKVYEDQKVSLMDLYAGFYSPCKISDTVFEPKGQGDMNDVMIDFSEGFDEFVESLEESYVNSMMRRRRAAILLKRMLSLKLPYSRLMYLYYYKRLDPVAIIDDLFISRATFYRIKSVAINILTSMYFSPERQNPEEHGECKL